MPKIVQYNLPPGGTVVQVADNTAVALDIESTDAKDYITANTTDGSESITLGQQTKITGPGGTTGMATPTGGGAPTLFLENSDGSSKDRCALLMNADGASGSMIDMQVADDRKLLIMATASQQTIRAEDTLVISSDPGEATRASISATNFNIQDLATIHAKNSADANGASYEFRKSRHAGDGSHTVVQDNDTLGEIKFSGSNGNAYSEAARIFARVNGTPGDDDMPTELVFATTPDGAEVAVERMTIGASGAVKITNGAIMLTIEEENGLTRHYFDDGNYYGVAGSGSSRTRLATSTANGSYLRYSPLHLGDELSTVDVAMLHPIIGADVTTDMPVIKLEQLNTSDNPYGLEINNTGTGDSIHDDSGAKLTAAGVWTDASDALHKEEIVDIPYGLAEVLQMQPRKYKLKKTGEEDIGFISQEMETIIPEVVFGDDAVMMNKIVDVEAKAAKLTDDGEEIDPAREEKARFNVPTGGKSLSYSHLTAVLVKAVQELTARVAELEAGD